MINADYIDGVVLLLPATLKKLFMKEDVAEMYKR